MKVSGVAGRGLLATSGWAMISFHTLTSLASGPSNTAYLGGNRPLLLRQCLAGPVAFYDLIVKERVAAVCRCDGLNMYHGFIFSQVLKVHNLSRSFFMGRKTPDEMGFTLNQWFAMLVL